MSSGFMGETLKLLIEETREMITAGTRGDIKEWTLDRAQLDRRLDRIEELVDKMIEMTPAKPPIFLP